MVRFPERFDMQMVPKIGAVSLGIVIGWLVRFYIRRSQDFNTQTLKTLVSILVGGAVIRFLDADKTVWWFYPIGLLIGFIVYSVVAVLAGGAKVEGSLYSALPKMRQGDDEKER
jgi:urea transporter